MNCLLKPGKYDSWTTGLDRARPGEWDSQRTGFIATGLKLGLWVKCSWGLGQEQGKARKNLPRKSGSYRRGLIGLRYGMTRFAGASRTF